MSRTFRRNNAQHNDSYWTVIVTNEFTCQSTTHTVRAAGRFDAREQIARDMEGAERITSVSPSPVKAAKRLTGYNRTSYRATAL